MREHAGPVALVLALSAGLLSPGAASGQLEPFSRFSIGDPALCRETVSDIASQPGGAFVVAFSRSFCPLLGDQSNRALAFDAAGRRLGGETSLWAGSDLVLAPLPDGGYVAASWFETDLGPLVGSGIGLHHLDALGRPIGAPIVVAEDPSSFSPNATPRLAVAPDGAVAVVWFSSSIGLSGTPVGRFFDAALNPTTEVFPLATGPDGFGLEPDVAFDAGGVALAVWPNGLGPGNSQILGRRFSAQGEPLGPPVSVVRDDGRRFLRGVRVVPRSGGGWWVAWQGFDPSSTTFLRRLDPFGIPIGDSQGLGIDEGGGPFTLGSDGLERILLATSSPGGAIVGRLFDGEGEALSAGIVVAAPAAGSLLSQPIAADRAPSFTAAWTVGQLGAEFESEIVGGLFAPLCPVDAACLGPGGRYAIDVSWTSPAGPPGPRAARPLPLTGGAATFGLRDLSGQEVAVRISGATANDFALAATTGAALEIRVIDRATGASRTFVKPAGRFSSQRFPNLLPFPTAGAMPALEEVQKDLATTLPERAASALTGETCTPSAAALCLLGGRFRVEAQILGPVPAPAQALSRTDRTGAFAFPSLGQTPAVTVTMIDGRAANGHFWVYLGGLSRFAYRVTVTDVEAGMMKKYENSAGRFESRADRLAF